MDGHPDRWRILVVLCAALCIVVLDNTILTVALPRLGSDLDATERHLQWITAAYGLVLASLLLPLAGLGDRFGRKGLLLVGVALFGTTSALAAFAATADQLVIARGLMGVGGAATMPATLAVLSNVFPDHERGRAIALWSGVSAIAGAAGPVIGGLLLEHFWWGSVFLVNIPVTVAVFVGAVRLVPRSHDPSTPPLDLVGSALWTGALALVLYSVIEGEAKGWSTLAVVGPIVVGAALLASFAWWERRTPHPLLSPRDVASPQMQAGMVAVPVIFFAVFGAQFVLSQWLQGVQGLSPLAAGAAFVPNALAVLGGSLLSTTVVARLGQARATAVGLVVLASALVLAAAFHSSVAPVLVALVVAGLGVGLATPPAVELIMGSVTPDRAGSAAGVNETIVEAGGAFGIAVMGSVLAVAAGGVASVAPDELEGAGAAAQAARDAFTTALAAPLLVAACLVAFAAVFVVRRMAGLAAWRASRPELNEVGGLPPEAASTTGS